MCKRSSRPTRRASSCRAKPADVKEESPRPGRGAANTESPRSCGNKARTQALNQIHQRSPHPRTFGARLRPLSRTDLLATLHRFPDQGRRRQPAVHDMAGTPRTRPARLAPRRAAALLSKRRRRVTAAVTLRLVVIEGRQRGVASKLLMAVGDQLQRIPLRSPRDLQRDAGRTSRRRRTSRACSTGWLTTRSLARHAQPAG